MPRPALKLKIDVTQIVKEALYRAKSGKVHLDLVCWERDSDYDDDGIVKQAPASTWDGDPKSLPILGNFTLGADLKGASDNYRPAADQRRNGPDNGPQEDPDDDIPF